MGGIGSGRIAKPACRAGQELVKWAGLQIRSKPMSWLALEIGVDLRTLQRWIRGEREPSVTQAIKVECLTGVSVKSWGEP